MTLRARILTGFALVLVLLIGLGVVTVAAQRNQLIGQLDRQLEAIIPLDRPAPFGPNAGPPPGGSSERSPDQDRQVDAPISDVFIALRSVDGATEVLVRGQLLSDDPNLDSFGDTDVRVRTVRTVSSLDGSTNFRVLADPAGRDTTFIAIPTTNVDETIQRLTIGFALVAALVAALLGLVAWWITRLGLQPISAMTITARAITRGDRDRRAPESEDRTEAGELGRAFNLMLDQRDEAEDKLRQFASDASHELRTPLTSIRGYLDLYAQGAFQEPGQLDDVVRRMRSEAERMGVLVEDLLQLARLDETRPLDISTADVGLLVSDVVADALAGHPERQITADAPAVGDVMATIDRAKVKQLVASLVDNSLIHAPEARVDVRASATADQLTIVVSDDGPGMTAEQAEQVFTRFYRGDSSRSRATGGSGLGLAIAQSIAGAHGGTIELQTNPGDGCAFTLVIPRWEEPNPQAA